MDVTVEWGTLSDMDMEGKGALQWWHQDTHEAPEIREMIIQHD